MVRNLYWNIYRGLEEEMVHIAEIIHIDDAQIGVYSIKIAELLIRTCVEIESISKELYYREGGLKKESNDTLYFDTDCLELLEKRWVLSKKEVLVSSPLLYLQASDNRILTPLKKASKRGKSGADWKRAYQAVKHDRGKFLKHATI